MSLGSGLSKGIPEATADLTQTPVFSARIGDSSDMPRLIRLRNAPQQDGAFPASGSDQVAIAREGNGVNGVRLTLERRDFLARRCFPDPDDLVLSGRGQGGAVRR